MDPEMQALRQQSDAMARQGAAFRQGVSGIRFSWAPKPALPLCGAFSALRSSQEQGTPEPGGFEQTRSCTLRVDRCHARALGFAPAIGQLLTRSDTAATLRIADIADNGISPEIVLTLEDPNA